MATLVLGAVGTALGGSIGGALGGLIGQSIDHGLLGIGRRRGPRMGDLSVQTSSYGSPVPQIFGTMRVAGTVIWATDLQEHEAVDGGGKGSPDRAGYSYSVNMAVALSSRPVRAVRRIWADGKLIRGDAGDFKVKAKFRLLSGSEDQQIDPLIGSVETIAFTPAYRGTALAIFEEFELAEFGNRIPALTFELEADNEPVPVGQVLADCSDGLIECDNAQTVTGFAAYGSSVRDALQPLIDAFDVELAERDGKLRSISPPLPLGIAEDELGCTAGDEPKSRIEHEREPVSALPARTVLSYYDPERDYQAGQMHAAALDTGLRNERTELPAVISAEQAKKLVEQGLANRLASSSRVKVCLPPAWLGLRPGDAIRLPKLTRSYVIHSVTVDGLAVEVEARPSNVQVPSLPADPGRPVTEPDLIVGRTELALVELPAMGIEPESGPRLCLAASNEGQWKPVPVELAVGSEPLEPQGLLRRAVLGKASSILPARVPAIFDEISAVTVKLANANEILLNADVNALLAGANLAMLGDELIQFGRAEQLGAGLFRLTKLLRGRRGTEWAAALHAVGEPFVMLDPAKTCLIELAPTATGALISATAFGIGDVAPQPIEQCIVTGEAMRPPPPCHVRIRRDQASVTVSWVRRSHLGWAWNDSVATPADAFSERYRVTLTGSAGTLETETSTPRTSFDLAAIPAEAGETVSISVAMIGPMALSREASANFTL